MAYKDLVPVGSGLIIAASSFGLGVIYSQLPYDINTLWSYQAEAFDVSLKHYAQWSLAPPHVHYILHFVMALGLVGSFIKLYKPSEDAKYFEYGSLVLFMIAIIIYLTNVRVGAASCVSGMWGDVDKNTGINVIAASEVMIVMVLVGVLVLQAGLYYAEWYDLKLKEEFFKEQAELEAKRRKQNEGEDKVVEEEVVKASGVKGKKKLARKA